MITEVHPARLKDYAGRDHKSFKIRKMKTKTGLLLFLFLNVSTFLSGSNSPLAGIWIGVDMHDGRKDTYTFTIKENKAGEFTGYIETEMDGALLPRMPFSKIEYNHPDFKLFINAGDLLITYAGRMSEDLSQLDGSFKYSDPEIPEKKLFLTRKTNEKLSESGYQYKQPVSKVLPIASLNESDPDRTKITKLVNDINQGKYGEINSLLVFRDGKLVLEEYFNGFDSGQLHQLQSVTKSITSLLIGIAIDKGYIDSADDKVVFYFDDYKYAKGWETVTIRHLLTMSSGVEWIKDDPDSPWDKDESIADMLKKPVTGKTGMEFNYNSAMQILAGIIEKSTKMELERFAEKYLFQPLEIKDYLWQASISDTLPLCTGSLKLRPVDMVKIGMLVLNKGRFDEKQVISENWINASTKVQIEVPGNKGDHYGYLWWIKTTSPQCIYAHGFGSQFIFVIPESNLVITTTGNNMYNNQDMKPFQMLKIFQ